MYKYKFQACHRFFDSFIPFDVNLRTGVDDQPLCGGWSQKVDILEYQNKQLRDIIKKTKEEKEEKVGR